MSTPIPNRAHKATYARDKRAGGYNVRVIGPHAAKFAGREVPVTRKDNMENLETLDFLIWSGIDDKTGSPCALYAMKRKEKAEPKQYDF